MTRRCDLLVRLVSWKEDLARDHARALENAGFRVDASPLVPKMSQFRANAPAVVLIDLYRLPSHGREVAVSLRSSKATRMIPIVAMCFQSEKNASGSSWRIRSTF